MNTFPIEIEGKEYKFLATREALKQIDVNQEQLASGSFKDILEQIEAMFIAYIVAGQPEMKREEALRLLDVALEEYGFQEISQAMSEVTSYVFTVKPSGKTIAWLKNKK